MSHDPDKISGFQSPKFAAMSLESFARKPGYNEEEHSWQVLLTVSIIYEIVKVQKDILQIKPVSENFPIKETINNRYLSTQSLLTVKRIYDGIRCLSALH